MLNHMVVDHRPKALTVGGFVEEEKDELLQHFSVSVTCELSHVSFPAGKSSSSWNSNKSELLPKNTSATILLADAAGSPLSKKPDFVSLQYTAIVLQMIMEVEENITASPNELFPHRNLEILKIFKKRIPH